MSTEAGFELGFDFFIGMGEKMDAMSKSMRRIESMLQPARYPAVGVITTPGVATSPVLLPIPSSVGVGSPAIGHVWQIIKIGIFGADDHTTLAGVTASVYVGPVAGQEGGANVADLASCVAANVAIPYLNLVGKDRIWMDNNDAIYAWLYSASMPLNQQVTMVVAVDDYRVWAKETMIL